MEEAGRRPDERKHVIAIDCQVEHREGKCDASKNPTAPQIEHKQTKPFRDK